MKEAYAWVGTDTILPLSPPAYRAIRIQRYIIRILFVSPVYALGSLFSLRFPGASVGLETVRREGRREGGKEGGRDIDVTGGY